MKKHLVSTVIVGAAVVAVLLVGAAAHAQETALAISINWCDMYPDDPT